MYRVLNGCLNLFVPGGGKFMFWVSQNPVFNGKPALRGSACRHTSCSRWSQNESKISVERNRKIIENNHSKKGGRPKKGNAEKLKEHFIHSPKEETGYAYYPSDRQLYIDHSDYLEDGFCNICINDRYRVEHIRKNEYWLYDLEDVEKEPENYRFKMKIRRS